MSQHIGDPYDQMAAQQYGGGGGGVMMSANAQNMYQQQQSQQPQQPQYANMGFQQQQPQYQSQQQYAQHQHHQPAPPPHPPNANNAMTPYNVASAAPQRGGSEMIASKSSSSMVAAASAVAKPQTAAVSSNAQQHQQRKETSANSEGSYTIIEQPVKVPRDRGVSHNEETIHVTRFAVQWGGKLGDVLQTPFSIVDKELKNYFQTGVKNIDKLLGNIGVNGSSLSSDVDKENAVILKNIFVGRVKILYASTSFKNIPLAIIANDPIEDWNHIFRPGTSKSKALAIVSHKNPVTPAHELLAIDKIAVVESKTFLTFGHVSSDDFDNDIEYMDDDDRFVYLSTTSVLNQVILDNRDEFMHRCDWDGKLFQMKDRGRCRYPFQVVADAIVQYRFEIDPLRKKCGIYDLSNGITFSVAPAFDSSDSTIGSVYNNSTRSQMLSQDGVIEMQLEVTFTFPRSVYGRYLAGKMERETPRDKFFSVLNNSLQKYSSSSNNNNNATNRRQ